MRKKITNILARRFPLIMGWCRYKFDNDQRWKIREEILGYYKTQPQDQLDCKIKEALTYIKRKGVHIFPYSFSDKYDPLKIKVYTDDRCDLPYVMHNDHRLYMPKGMSVRLVQKTYTYLINEQDREAAHCYETEDFGVDEGDILLDVGAAEGIFALSVIDKVKKVYLFEAEKRWIEPLKETFSPWKDKVEIIHKYVSDSNNDTSVRLDSAIKETSGNTFFIKLDVEGAEKIVLEGAKNILTSDEYNIKAAICTYHNTNDYEELSKIMTDMNYKTATSTGYMLLIYRGLEAPYFRRGLIYCCKSGGRTD